MVNRDTVCRACEGTGMLADDESWQYKCTVCGGTGHINPGATPDPPRFINVDDNNRILD